ncbi:MAG: hypothetical protein IT371_13040 [Deltaproteobacteria bacterium]|nr:hypothetical protein [Deltaproteobacteria bacterium]
MRYGLSSLLLLAVACGTPTGAPDAGARDAYVSDARATDGGPTPRGDADASGRGSPDAYQPPPPLPSQAHLRAVWGSGPSDVFAVGDHGTVAHYDGKRWTGLTVGSEALHAVWGTGPGNVYVGGEGGRILRYDGKAFTQVAERSRVPRVRGLWGSSPTNVYAVGGTGETGSGVTRGLIVRFDGARWSEVAIGPARAPEVDAPWGAEWTAVWGSSASDVFVTGYRQHGPHEVVPAGSTVIEAAYLAHYDGKAWSGGMAEGATWQLGALTAVWGSGPSDVYAVGATAGGKPTGSVLRFDGASWTRQPGAPAGSFSGLYGFGGAELFVVGTVADPGPQFDWAGLWRLESGSWSRLPVPATSTLSAVWGSSPVDLFVVGPTGLILHYDGRAWSRMTLSP